MATLSQAESRRMYSWWWDSHISPKNSKWLQDNLTDMDAKVKAMIKLIEEDADSFARRAEMYYKKRPELMKIVEDFYRAYRSLAERYDHATGVIRQAQRSMAEAFPNQVPLICIDDLPASSASDPDPRTLEMSPPTRTMFDLDDPQKDALGPVSSHVHTFKRNGTFSEDPESVTNKKGLKQVNDLVGFKDHARSAEGMVLRGLSFHVAEEQSNINHISEVEKELLVLKEALATLEAEKENERETELTNEVQTLKEALKKSELEREASLLKHEQCMERISNLEIVSSRAQEEVVEFKERATKANTEAQVLKQQLEALEAEKDAALDQYSRSLERMSSLEVELLRAEEDAKKINGYAEKAGNEVENLKQVLTDAQVPKQQCDSFEGEKVAALDQYEQFLQRVSSLEKTLLLAEEDTRMSNERAKKAESEVENLKQTLSKVQVLKQQLNTLEAEKETALDQYKLSLERISNLEKKLLLAEEDARKINERAEKAECEVKNLKQAITKLNEEKETTSLQYHQYLETISSLELNISCAKDETEKFKSEIDNWSATLKGAEERCIMLERSNQSLHCELESLVLKIQIQTEEFSEKQKECEKLWTCIQEERLRYAEVLNKSECEREASLIKHHHCVEKISNLENVISWIKDEAVELNEQASKAETEAQVLKQKLGTLEAEKDAALDQYKQTLETISNMEKKLLLAEEDARKINERAEKAEIEVENLKQALIKDQVLKQQLETLEAEKIAAVDQYRQSLERISCLEKSLSLAEEDARKSYERTAKAETEFDNLKQALVKLTEEKETAVLQYHQCLETIYSLELKISFAQEEVEKLRSETDNWDSMLKGADEQCVMLERSNQSLQSELESLVVKMRTQTEELSKKQKDCERLWTCAQEESLRFLESDIAFHALHHIHCQAQEELEYLDSELQNRAQKLRAVETHNGNLQEEFLKTMEENRHLNELNLSSSVSIKAMQDEILFLREKTGKLEEEVENQVNKRNTLQHEIYSVKEKMNELNKKHEAMLEQIDDVGFDPEGFGSSVKELKDDYSNLNEAFRRETSEKIALMDKLEITDQLLEKISLLENSLSEMSDELERVRWAIKVSEESCQSLQKEKTSLVAERATLMSQLQVTTEKLEKLSEKCTFMENSLCDGRDELEGLKANSVCLKDLCQLLDNEKSCLMSQKDTLIAQLEITQKKLDEKEKNYMNLEDKFSSLQVYLDTEKHEHALYTALSEKQLAGMETQIRLLQEEGWLKKRKYEEELDKATDSEIEIFILQRCVQDQEERNFSLFVKCQKLVEASKISEKLSFELKSQNLEQNEKMTSLCDQINILRRGICAWLKKLNIDLDNGCEYNTDHILGKLGDAIMCTFMTRDENQQLAVQISVLVTLIEQFKLEAQSLKIEKYILNQEIKMRTEQFSLLQREGQNLLEVNEELRSKLREGNHKEEVLTMQMECLQQKFLNLQGVYEKLQMRQTEILEDKRFMRKEFLELGEKNCSLEEVSCSMFGELLFLRNLCGIYENFFDEKSGELKKVGEDLEKLLNTNGAFEQKLRIKEEKFEEVEMENFHFKGTLWKLEDEFKTVESIRDQLRYEITNVKDLLLQKEMELSEVKQKLAARDNEKLELQKIEEELKRENNEIELIRRKQEKQISKLSEANGHLGEENRGLCETINKFEAELHQMCEENDKRRVEDDKLRAELQKVKNEIHQWETDTTTFFHELQLSCVYRALFEEKAHELNDAYGIFRDHSKSKDMDIELLKQKICTVEGENGGLKDQLAAYVPNITSLRDCISSLENHLCLLPEIQKIGNEDKEEVIAQDAIAEFRTRIQAIEKAVMEMEKLAAQENIDVNSKLEAATRQIEELQSKISSYNLNLASEISEAESGLRTKDIMLDQISESSSHGISRRDHDEIDNQMLELWERADQYGSTDPTISNTKKKLTVPEETDNEYHRHKRAYSRSQVVIEKELPVDKLEVPERTTEPPREDEKIKTLERLHSDVHKLTNLRITVHDLKRKVDINEKDKKGKAFAECDTVKRQLKEAEEAIEKLTDLNGKLTRNIEDNSFSSDGNLVLDSEEHLRMKRKIIPKQAQRLSEKIGLLQLEVQKIQFVVLKLDDEKEKKGRTRIRDYLYSTLGISLRRKKTACCACVQPATKED